VRRARIEGGQDGVMRVVISFVGGWGHAEPLLPIARWATQLGHHVSFAGQAALRDRLVRLGYLVDVIGPDTLATAPLPLVPIDRLAEQAAMRDHFIGRFGRRRAALLGEQFERDEVELVVCDEVDVGAVIAAERRDIPCVTVNVIAAGLLTAPTVIGAAWNALRRDHGLLPDPEARRVNGEIMIAPLPKSLRSPNAPAPSTLRFVRPAVLDGHGPGHDVPERRSLVYVTLGTVFNLESGDLLTRLVHAMNLLTATDDVDVVITTGHHIHPDELPPPAPRVRIEKFVSQRQVLHRCGAVVCHAGSGTLVDAMSLGIPLVALPLGADQPDNADRCQELGTGITLDAISATPDLIADVTTTVLHDQAFTEAARTLAVEAQNQPLLEDQPELQHLLASAAP